MPPHSSTSRREPRVRGRHRPWHQPVASLPHVPLILMAATGFITYLTETLPVGVMPDMRDDPALGMSEGTIGQLVTIYAVGCGVAAIPTTLMTRHLPRRSLLLSVLSAFIVCNAGTGLASDFWVMAVCRAGAGVCAGLLWAMLAGYAIRLVEPGIQGKAMALAMAGTPLALSFGTPLGAVLGDLLGWRLAFIAASGLAALVALVGLKILPMVPGEAVPREERRSVGQVLALPGLAAVIAVTAIFSVGHNAAYTFVPPIAQAAGVKTSVGLLLLVFGIAAAAGLFVIGRHVDARLRTLTVVVCFLLALALAGLWYVRIMPSAALPVLVLWGLAFGGAPTLFQTASARICGQSQEVGQALIVTTYNSAAAVAAATGGALVDGGLTQGVPWLGVGCALLSTVIVLGATTAFPGRRREAEAPRTRAEARSSGATVAHTTELPSRRSARMARRAA